MKADEQLTVPLQFRYLSLGSREGQKFVHRSKPREWYCTEPMPEHCKPQYHNGGVNPIKPGDRVFILGWLPWAKLLSDPPQYQEFGLEKYPLNISAMAKTKPPKGFRWAGEIRNPRIGDWYLGAWIANTYPMQPILMESLGSRSTEEAKPLGRLRAILIPDVHYPTSLEIPFLNVPQGYEFTGEYRAPEIGEYFWDHFIVQKCQRKDVEINLLIMRPVEARKEATSSAAMEVSPPPAAGRQPLLHYKLWNIENVVLFKVLWQAPFGKAFMASDMSEVCRDHNSPRIFGRDSSSLFVYLQGSSEEKNNLIHAFPCMTTKEAVSMVEQAHRVLKEWADWKRLQASSVSKPLGEHEVLL